MATLFLDYNLGDFVCHPDQEDWGMGQVQSIQGSRVTVNFQHAGKLTIDASVITLNLLSDDEVAQKTI